VFRRRIRSASATRGPLLANTTLTVLRFFDWYQLEWIFVRRGQAVFRSLWDSKVWTTLRTITGQDWRNWKSFWRQKHGSCALSDRPSHPINSENSASWSLSRLLHQCKKVPWFYHVLLQANESTDHVLLQAHESNSSPRYELGQSNGWDMQLRKALASVPG
jgi:hypothetical protein